MKKLMQLLVIASQIIMGADKESTDMSNIVLEILNFTTQQYQELEALQEDERAANVIYKIKAKTPAQLACNGYADLADITRGFNNGNISQIQLYDITEAMILDIEILMSAISTQKKVELEVACAAKEIAILYELAKSKHAASIIQAKEGISVQKIARLSFAELAKNADWFEKGQASDRMVCNIVKCLVDNTHRIVNSIKHEAPYLFEKGKYGRRKSI